MRDSLQKLFSIPPAPRLDRAEYDAVYGFPRWAVEAWLAENPGLRDQYKLREWLARNPPLRQQYEAARDASASGSPVEGERRHDKRSSGPDAEDSLSHFLR